MLPQIFPLSQVRLVMLLPKIEYEIVLQVHSSSGLVVARRQLAGDGGQHQDHRSFR